MFFIKSEHVTGITVMLLLSLFSLKAIGQDVQFSQFYNVPTYLNPGFAGSAHQTRAIAHHRMQWPGLDARYTTSLVSLDHYLPQHKSGFGLMVMQDYMGANTINSTNIVAQYAYEIHVLDNLTFRPGLQLGYMSRGLNYSNLRFPQQFDDQGQNSTGNPYGFGDDRIHMVDFGTGGIVYSNNLWVGFSAHHLNKPNQSFFGEVSRLPVQYLFVSGYKIKLKSKEKYMAYLQQQESEIAIIPTFNYKSQGSSDQFDIGVYGIYDMVIAGLWYRGIPTKKYSFVLHNNESVVMMGGFKFGNYSISYSYDYIVSRLSSVRTFGAHEINFTFINSKKAKKNKPMKRLPCPSFYR
jgi:type IX secretion system PorP/SprF family membrane protein